jgi:hypothetical protein
MSSIDDLDLDDVEEKLPPFWGRSYWWTRAGAVLGLTSLVTGIAMVGLLSKHLGSCGLPNQLTTPTLAIEVAGTWNDLAAIVGPCEALHCGQSQDGASCVVAAGCKPVCPDKVAALVAEQYQDYGFIIIYWLFFVYLGVVNWKFCYWARFPAFSQVLGKAGGFVAVVAGSWGAVRDWRENQHILQALSELHLIAGPVPLMRDFAYEKWRLLFLAIGAAAPIFVFWSGRSNNAGLRHSTLSHLLAACTAILAVATAWTGFAACKFGDDHRLEVAAQRLDLVILSTMLTLATAQLWRGGTLAALNRLAEVPPLRFFANLFSSEADAQQTPDTDPNRML